MINLYNINNKEGQSKVLGEVLILKQVLLFVCIYTQTIPGINQAGCEPA